MSATIAAIDRTWANPDAARMWLKRNPQDADLRVSFDSEAAVYRLRPPSEDEQQKDTDDMARKAVKVRGPAHKPAGSRDPKPAAAPPQAVTEAPPQAIKVRDAILAIRGLPAEADAFGWARDLALRLRQPIEVVRMKDGKLLDVITPEAAREFRKASKGQRKPAGERKPRAEGPSDKVRELLDLALRPGGVSAAELTSVSGWTGAPWKWNFHNPKGKGWAQRFGYDFRTEKIDGETRYILAARKAA